MRPLSSSEPQNQIAKPYTFEPGFNERSRFQREWVEVVMGPGDALNLSTGKRFNAVRDKIEHEKVPYAGVHLPAEGKPYAEDVPNPDAPDGRWDPYQFMPRFAFQATEDAFPIDPDFDGDGKLGTNSPEKPNGKDTNYKDGMIGGNQNLDGAFTVTRKGKYTILTYSFYYAHNKAIDYHTNDYSTAQVYLAPGKDGKLAPEYLYTSWHHGAMLTPWKDLAKDANGRPQILVHQGSHSLQAIGQHQKLPEKGLQIGPDGQAALDGKPLPNRLSFDALQTNVQDARYLDPANPATALRLKAMSWGEAALNPFLPEVFEQAPSPWSEAVGRMVSSGRDKAEGLWKKFKGLFSK